MGGSMTSSAVVNGVIPAGTITPTTTVKLRQQAHARMLGNSLCNRPVELDCHLESACETCAYFSTGPEFVPVLIRQRDRARQHHQPDRAALFDTLIDQGDGTSP
jgi:hypothetical protein